jgi:lipopolysaccharide assembly outer membrane protein LptD (OstA)
MKSCISFEEMRLSCGQAPFGSKGIVSSWILGLGFFLYGSLGHGSANPDADRLGQTFTLPSGATIKKISLSAEKLFYQRGLGRLEFSGKVQVTADDFSIHAALVRLYLNDKGAMLGLEAMGQVALVIGEERSSSDKAFLSFSDGKMRLVGNVHLRLKALGITLQGAEIQLEMRSGNVTVMSARASIQARGFHGQSR